MSFEGYTEFLCEKGHYTTDDTYGGPKLRKCHCGEKFAHWHLVDQTNGYDPNYEETFPASKSEIGWDDVWHEDHYGNRYATKDVKYSPHGGAWKKF